MVKTAFFEVRFTFFLKRCLVTGYQAIIQGRGSVGWGFIDVDEYRARNTLPRRNVIFLNT